MWFVVFKIGWSFVKSVGHIYFEGNLRFLPGMINDWIDWYEPIGEKIYYVIRVFEIVMEYHGINFFPYV